MAPLNGVYRGPCGCYVQNPASVSPAANLPQAGITSYAAWLGKPVTYVLDYQASAPASWAQFTGTDLAHGGTGFLLYNPPRGASGAANYQTLDKWCYSGGPTTLGGRTAMLGLSPCTGRSVPSAVIGRTWAEEASGANDANWLALGNNLVAWQSGAFANAYLRIGREFNYGGYNWSPSTTGDTPAQYIAGYQHIVTLLRGITGSSFKFMWNPALSPGTMGGQPVSSQAYETQNWYPGDAYVDSIGLDVYDWGRYPAQTASPWGYRTLAQQQDNFAYLTDTQDGLSSWNDFARLHGKQLAFPEWGLQQWLQGGTYIGGGDDPYFITSMASEMSSNCLMQAMWEDLGMGVFDTDAYAGRTANLQAPDASRSTFLFYFGNTNTGSGGIPYSGAGSLTGNLEEKITSLTRPAGSPPGPTGTGGTSSPSPGTGWEIFVRSYADYTTLLCQVPGNVWISFQAVKQLNDVGSGSVTLDMDSPWWKLAVMGGGATANEILDFECLWQITQDGVVRIEFLGETVSEQLVNSSEQRLVTVTGPGTAATLKWAMAAPQGFPSIVLKMDGLKDSFGEIGANGAGVLDTNIWNVVSPAGNAYITPVPQPASGAGVVRSAPTPTGTLTIAATTGTTLLGSTPWDATDTLVSAKISPVGIGGTATDSGGNPLPYGTGLDGSELTQMYVESLKTSSYVAGFGLSAQYFYAWSAGPDGTQTKTICPAGSYDLSNFACWMITEQGGSGGGPGTFYWWTSPDGSTWTQQWSVPHSWDATMCGFFLTAKYDAPGKSVILSGINSNVTTPSYQGNLYLGESAMGIWLDLLAKSKSRGTIPFISASFTAAADSFGNPWTDVQNVQVTNGSDLFNLLQAFCHVLNADFCMQPGFNLQVGQDISLGGNAVSLGSDRSGQVIFREGKDELAKQRIRARDKLANLLGVENSDGREISANSASSISQWGQREGWFQTSALVDITSMEIAAAAFTAATDTEVLSWTLSILPNVPGRTIFTSFDVGDWVGLERPDFTAVDAERVIAIAIQVNQDGVETHELTLQSYLAYLQEQFAYISTKLGGGFVNLPGTTPVAPGRFGTGVVPTWFTPAATLGSLADVVGTGGHSGAPLVYNAATGQWQSATDANPVSGTALGLTVPMPGGTVSISNGQVSVSSGPPAPALEGAGGTPPPAASVTHTPTGTIVKDATGSTRVVIGQQGDGTITVVETNGPPPLAPDVPVVTAGVLGVVVGWDGLLGGAAPLADFKWTEVHVSTSSGFTPSTGTLQGTMSAGGLFGVGALTAGTTYYVRLMARNKSSAASAASTQASAVPLASSTGSGSKVTTSGTAPSSPVTGDLWYNSSNGNALTQWNGSSWVPVPFGAGAIATGSITSAQIASAAAITGSQLAAAAAITGTQLSSTAAITGTQLAAAAGITGTQLAAAAGITGTQLSTTAGITGSQLSAAAGITGSQIAGTTIALGNLAGAVTARALNGITTTIATTAPGSPITGDLWINTTTGVIERWTGAAWTVVTFNAANAIQATSITAGLIAAHTITAAQIAAGTITTNEILANTILAANIAANTITAGQIAASTITTTEIAANTILAGDIAANAITTPALNANAVTAAKIATNTITAAQLAAGIVYAGIVDATTITGGTLIADGVQGQVLIYNGPPGSGNLAGSWSGKAGTDPYGNTYPAGLRATTGTFSGSGMTGANISASTFNGGSVVNAAISSSDLSGGTISETQITFDQVGGILLVYTTTTTAVTLNSGASWTAPAGFYTQGKVECWGSDASGSGGNATNGGEGGGGGAYSCEPSYPLTPGAVYSTQIGVGGPGVLTSYTGSDGGQTAFDGGGVVADGGWSSGGFSGGPGGAASDATISYPGGNGGQGGLGAASGGGGGRAGSTGAGGNGGNGGGSPGAAGAAGSGTGGHVGGAGVAAATAGNAGGGGSGAGQGGAGTTYKTVFYDATSTASYYGSTVGGGLKNTNGSMYQGCASGYMSSTGDQVSFANYNSAQMASDWSGWTIDKITITINNQASWYNTGCYCILGYASGGTNHYNQVSFWCNEGVTTGPVDVTSTFAGQIGVLAAIILGPSSSTSGGSTDLYNYGYFQGGAGQGSPRITVSGHQGTGGSYRSGAGQNGVIKITYASAANLIGAIAPVSGTDAIGNAYGAGYTGTVQTFHPGSAPAVVETWQTVPASGTNGFTTGWAQYGTRPLQYKLRPDGTVHLWGVIVPPSSPVAGAAIVTLPSGYYNTSNAVPILAEYYGTTAGANGACYLELGTTGGLQFWGPVPPSGPTIRINSIIPVT